MTRSRPGHLGDRQVLRAIGDRVAEVARRTRQRIDRVAVADPVTCDLLVRTAATLEKQLSNRLKSRIRRGHTHLFLRLAR